VLTKLKEMASSCLRNGSPMFLCDDKWHQGHLKPVFAHLVSFAFSLDMPFNQERKFDTLLDIFIFQTYDIASTEAYALLKAYVRPMHSIGVTKHL
jgi:hypothetical protein